MKRKEFFKRFGLGVAAAIVAPKAIAAAIEEVKEESLMDKIKPLQYDINEKWLRLNPKTVKESFEWYEPPRLHFRCLVKIIDVGENIEVSVPTDINLRLHDIVFMADQNFMVSSIDVNDKGFYQPLDLLEHYEFTGNVLYQSSGRLQHIALTPFNKPKKPFKIGDKYLMMLVGNDYIPDGSDKT